MTLRLSLSSAAAAASVLAAPLAAAAAPDLAGARLLEIEGFAGQIEVRTRPDAAFTVDVQPGRSLTAEVARRGDTITVRGPLGRGDNSRCSRDGSDARVVINGRTHAMADLPRLVVTGPDAMGLRIKRSLVSGTVGNVGGATLGLMGCGDLTLGDVARDLELSLAGSGDLRAGRIGGNVEASIAGAGSTALGAVGGNTKVNVAGSGDVDIASARALEASIAGSGDVRVRGGVGRLSVSVAGSGNVRHDGTVIDPSISIVGSGEVSVARLQGQPRVARMGSGRFAVDGQ